MSTEVRHLITQTDSDPEAMAFQVSVTEGYSVAATATTTGIPAVLVEVLADMMAAAVELEQDGPYRVEELAKAVSSAVSDHRLHVSRQSRESVRW